jgi:hypothetical protein
MALKEKNGREWSGFMWLMCVHWLAVVYTGLNLTVLQNVGNVLTSCEKDSA